MKFIFFLWLSLFSLCCVQPTHPWPDAHKPHVTMHVDTDFTEAERKEIKASADLWSQQTSDQAHITVLYDLDFNSMETLKKASNEDWNVLVRMTSDLQEVIDNDCESAERAGLPCGLPGGPQVLAWVSPSGGIHNPWGQQVIMKVVVDRAATSADLRQTIVHEFGHVLGLPHSPAPQAIMAPWHVTHSNVCLTPADLQLFCTVNVCTKPTLPCEG